MNCVSIFEQLDCVRPNSADLALPEFADARAHLEVCSSCRTEFARRQRFDSAVAEVMQSVPVPATHAANLLETLAAAKSMPVAAPSESGSKPQRSRRWRIVALTACMLVVLGVVFWPTSSNELAVGEVLARLTINESQLDRFDGAFNPPKPFEWSAISVDSRAFGQDLDGRKGHEAMLRRFQFDTHRGHVVQGVLVAIPAKRISPPPAADRFAIASPRYPSFEGQPFAVVAWQEGQWVYLCLIPNQPGDLELLQRSTHGTAA